MTKATAVEAARAGLPAFAAEVRDHYESIAQRVGAPFAHILLDPPAVGTYLQIWVDHLPLVELTADDWAALHASMLAYVACVLEHEFHATWAVAAHPDPPGYRYHLTARDRHGAAHRIDPFAIVNTELRHSPIEVSRMLAAANAALSDAGTTWECHLGR